MTIDGDFLTVLDKAIACLNGANVKSSRPATAPMSIPDALSSFEKLENEVQALGPRRMRTLHHFACSGGSLLAKCIGAQPNTVLLSELDPFSQLGSPAPVFAPRDLIRLAQVNVRPLDVSATEKTFLSGLKAMNASLTRIGRNLVLRDHTHSHFCTRAEFSSRPLLRHSVESVFETLSLVTVRHPLDSCLSLQNRGWVMFEPATLDEYAKRYHHFLDCYDGVPLVRYEDFVLDPDAQARRMANALVLPFSQNWREIFPIVQVTGDSGRKSDRIEPRPRRPVADELVQECALSASYQSLCERLGYNADPESPAYPE